MKKFLAVVLLVVALASPAQARHRHHPHHYIPPDCLDLGFNEDGTPIVVCT